MKITRLQADNFKRLVAVDITPDGNVITISGKNSAGKSSVLDSIVAALGGKAAAPGKPIREGEETAVVCVQTDSYTVTRKFTGAGSYLEVKTAEGAKVSSPQKLLDEIVGSISFDPLAYLNKPDREQRQILLDLVGIDTSVYDLRIGQIRDERNAAMAAKKAALAAMPEAVVGDVPDVEVSVAELSEKLSTAIRTNATRQRQIETLNQQKELLASLKVEIEQLHSRMEQCKGVIKSVENDVAAFDVTDTEPIQLQIANAEETNRKVRAKLARVEHEKRADELSAKVTHLGRTLASVEMNKANAFSEAEMPVQGLSVDETGVMLDGIPLAQVNHAKKLEVSMAIAMRMNPKLKVLLVDANGLDSDTLATVAGLAEREGFQVWAEKMDESGEVGVYIEDGTVRAVSGKAVE